LVIVLEVIFFFLLNYIDFLESFFGILVVGHNVFYYISVLIFILYRICIHSMY
jgi:hypothetical protein